PPVPVPTAVERMPLPGALISGFRWPSPKRGPPELKLANCRNAGFCRTVLVAVAEPEFASTNVAPVLDGVPKNGMPAPEALGKLALFCVFRARRLLARPRSWRQCGYYSRASRDSPIGCALRSLRRER